MDSTDWTPAADNSAAASDKTIYKWSTKKGGYFFSAGDAGDLLFFDVSSLVRALHRLFPSLSLRSFFFSLPIYHSFTVCASRGQAKSFPPHKINGQGSRFNHPFPMHDRAAPPPPPPRRPDPRPRLPPTISGRRARVWTRLSRLMRREVPPKSSFYGLPSLKAMQSRETHVFSDRVGPTELRPPRSSAPL